MSASWSVAGRRLLWVVLGLELLVLALGAWLGISAVLAFRDLSAARDDLLAARESVAASQLPEARADMAAAAEQAAAAARRLNGPQWDLLAAIPGLGDGADTVRAIADSAAQTATTLQPLVDQLGALDPTTLVSADGRIDVSAVQQAVPALQQAQPGIDSAVTTMRAAPSTGWVPRQVRKASAEYLDQLSTLQTSLNTAVTFGEIAGQLLGSDSPQRYFVGILNPNEARGTGGFLGSYAILSAEDGKLAFERVGSNTDLPNLTRLPASLDRQFRQRYGDAPLQRGTMNLSPHLPDTSAVWLASWEKKTGERLDGVIAVDVVALSSLVAASGQTIALPDGGSISGSELADFAIQGIYEKFPAPEQASVRKLYQVAVIGSALKTVASAPNPEAMARAVGSALSEHRMVVWSRDPDVENRLLAAGVGGSLPVPDGHHVAAVTLSTSNSKLDAYLDRQLEYQVGRCPDADGQVRSQVAFQMTNAIPFGYRPPQYMIGSARRLPNGPVNTSTVQIYLPNGAEALDVSVDGQPVRNPAFVEQDRPAIAVDLTLPPRQPRRIEVEFSEPASDGPGIVEVQPLAHEQVTTVVEKPC